MIGDHLHVTLVVSTVSLQMDDVFLSMADLSLLEVDVLLLLVDMALVFDMTLLMGHGGLESYDRHDHPRIYKRRNLEQ